MKKSEVIGGIVGVCVGDALGLPVQFASREDLKINPVKDMIGYGTFNMPPGTWSDDSSLTFCLAESLLHGFNLKDIAEKFIKWFDDGYWTPYGEAFDIGGTTQSAILRLKEGVSPTESGLKDEYSNGNGSLMRILPLIFYLENKDIEEQFEITHKVSCLTHCHPRSRIACGIYVQFGINLLKGNSKEESYEKMRETVTEYYSKPSYSKELYHFERILKEDMSKLPEDSIKSSGYVVDTLEASLWCFLNNNSFEDTVLSAVNLGDDTDTIGAISGGLAGIYYGFEAIPKRWVNRIARIKDIIELGERFYRAIYYKS